ncbi:MAG: peptidase S10, partial [Gammaproteobacteria bacterium]
VEQFASHQYILALNAGNSLGPGELTAIAEKLHDYTGLSTAYIEKSGLRIRNRDFRHALLGEVDQTVGDLDGRFAGPSMDPLSQAAQYDPQSAAISSAYVAGFNYYVHNILKYGRDQHYRPEAYNIVTSWPRKHINLVTGRPVIPFNAGVDLAQAMKYNPKLQIEVDMGYFDLNLPFGGMLYSINHLKIPEDLQSHIHEEFYYSGHMIYVHVPALKTLHDNTAAFIRGSDNLRG